MLTGLVAGHFSVYQKRSRNVEAQAFQGRAAEGLSVKIVLLIWVD
jgi:hypothetical protein